MDTRPHRVSTLSPRGFTLVEAVIAIVILSLAVPALFWAVRDAQTRRADPVQINRARWLASERLEEIIADRHSGSRGYAYVVNANYATESTVSGFTGFSRSVSIVETGPTLVNGSGTGYKRITVTVGFVDGRNTARSLSLMSVVTDYTP